MTEGRVYDRPLDASPGSLPHFMGLGEALGELPGLKILNTGFPTKLGVGGDTLVFNTEYCGT